ncbi:hypothetical protein Patl1_33301 [Pistacia atlantica]|uniref:Uncharacterized protein n=1 Tax=Pistacia atlantica TaxID=434234 RepID=A0ACC0ZSE5_9ROSI|nr:hypothetical protein Patl1_33301 [Pistacia atlantica]
MHGGGNIDWIKKFTDKTQEVAKAPHIKLHILYMGKSNLGRQIQGNISTINEEKLSLPLVRGSDMAIAKSENILKCLSDFDLWRTYMIEEDFVTVLNNYQRKLLKVQLMESPHKDNMEVLRALIHVKEDKKTLIKGDAKKTVC